MLFQSGINIYRYQVEVFQDFATLINKFIYFYNIRLPKQHSQGKSSFKLRVIFIHIHIHMR